MSERLRVCLQEGDEVLYAPTASKIFFLLQWNKSLLLRFSVYCKRKTFILRCTCSVVMHIFFPCHSSPPTCSRCFVQQREVDVRYASLLHVQLYNSKMYIQHASLSYAGYFYLIQSLVMDMSVHVVFWQKYWNSYFIIAIDRVWEEISPKCLMRIFSSLIQVWSLLP